MGKSGRKGYEYEKEQLDRMRKLLSRFTTLLEGVEKSGKISSEDITRFTILKDSVHMFAHKLHANKTDLKVDFEKPFLVLKDK